MADEIVSRAEMQQRGRAAFQRGLKRDEHGMNPWAPGIYEWHQGYDRAATESNGSAAMSPRFDMQQVAA